MILTRRRLIQRAASLCSIAVTGVVAGSEPAFAQHWANCSSGKQTVQFKSINATTKVATFSDWREGDCEMQSAQITITPTTFTFNAQVCTHFTHSKDIWHFYVELAKDTTSSTYLTEYSFDGPKMSEQDKPLYHAWSYTHGLPGGAFAQIKYARATSCC